jgi:P27 family predicted phage terminase small subunit
MGRRGPPPTPTALKILRGNPGRRPLNLREPAPPSAIPSPPTHLDAVARSEWRRVVPQLAKAQLLTLVDRAALTGYCLAWSASVDATRKLAASSTILTSVKGYPYQNPEVLRLNQALKQLLRFSQEFGMTPASRSRIEVDAPPVGGQLEAFRRRHPSG